mgnify:CR=1 FL=1
MDNRLMLRYLLLLLVMSFSFCCFAKKEKEKKRVAQVEMYGLVEPDPMPERPRPDHYSKPLDKPLLSYDGTEGLHGFDISHYQGHVNFDALATDPNAGYLYLKASEGANNKDNMYSTYYKEARRVGFKIGSYHFFRGNCSAREQFENFRSVLRGNHQDLIPIIDVEVLAKKVSIYQYMERLSELLIMVEREFGRKPMIYTGQRFYNKHFVGTKFPGRYKFMIACYTDTEPTLHNNDDFLIWQFTGSGSARGVRGHIDISKFVRGHTIREIMF